LRILHSTNNRTIEQLKTLVSENNHTIQQVTKLLWKDGETIQQLNALQATSNQTIERLSEKLHHLSGDLKNRNLTIEELKNLRLMDSRNAQTRINELQQSLAELNQSYNNRAVDSDSSPRLGK
jgi:uncharacterized coiled-coil protein SlyX